MLAHVLRNFSLHLLNQLGCPNNIPHLAPGRRVHSNYSRYREDRQPQLLTVSMDGSGSLGVILTESVNDLYMQHAPVTISLAVQLLQAHWDFAHAVQSIACTGHRDLS